MFAVYVNAVAILPVRGNILVLSTVPVFRLSILRRPSLDHGIGSAISSIYSGWLRPRASLCP